MQPRGFLNKGSKKGPFLLFLLFDLTGVATLRETVLEKSHGKRCFGILAYICTEKVQFCRGYPICASLPIALVLNIVFDCIIMTVIPCTYMFI